MPHRRRQLEQLNTEIGELRKRIISEQRKIADLQTSGHRAYGHIAHLRDLETSLRLMTSRRDILVQRIRNRDLRHGSQALATSHR